jgi:hypothetical protein
MHAFLRLVLCFFFGSLSASIWPAQSSADRAPVASARDAFGPGLSPERERKSEDRRGRRGGDDLTRLILRWNKIAIDASGLDHTPVAPGETRRFGEQLGPGRSSRAMAIVHIAIFDALASIEGRYQSYTDLERSARDASERAAVSAAAHDTLVAVFASQAASFDAELASDLQQLARKRHLSAGLAAGRRAAAAILAQRAGDGSDHPEPVLGVDHLTSNEPGRWRQDPISLVPIALGARWGSVLPFALDRPDQFRAPAPPALASPEYAEAFDEVKRLGGDGLATPTERSDEESFIGIFWAYDGTPSLCAPPRLYNQVATQVAAQRRTRDLELARLLALVNLAMADTGVATWESKYFYDFWRPITAIREADPGTGPSGLGDGNDATQGDAAFRPLGAPASNLAGVPDFTPPFPAYPSGHAAFGGALYEVLRQFYGRDDIAFRFVSDEFDGKTRGSDGEVRPLRPRDFESFSEAEEENGQSRIYLGIHFAFDKSEGIALGRRVAQQVLETQFRPLHGKRGRDH